LKAQIKKILTDHNLRQTQGRIDVVSVFFVNKFAVSHADIESGIENNYDRVTIYRTLKSFLECGLIHKVLDDNGTTRYALCAEACADGNHKHNHIHFKCTNCGQTSCLEHVNIPEVKLPKGFTPIESNYLISGVCDHCSNQSH
jgi:Fur family transcriptional regulator, ferric uptake regulator